MKKTSTRQTSTIKKNLRSLLDNRFLSIAPRVTQIGMVLGTDYSGNWLPGLPGGPKSMKETLEIIRRLENVGYRRLIATPVLGSGKRKISMNEVLRSMDGVRDSVNMERMNIDLDIVPTYRIDDDLLNELEIGVTTLDGKYLFTDLDEKMPLSNLSKYVFEILIKGYIPVLSHPELYPFLMDPKMKTLRKLSLKGVLLKLDARSLLGHHGNDVKRKARQLLRNGKYSMLGTNVHNVKEAKAIEAGIPIMRSSLEALTPNT